MTRLLALLGLLAGQASAETALVYSGEHEDFTRLVIEFPSLLDWTVGRTALGYAFAAVGETQPLYDTSQVFRRIPKTRLQALQTDADTGALRLTLACDCHVFPFEYQPGIVVLDIKPGPAPVGSSFEKAFGLPTYSDPPQPKAVVPPSYNWLESEPDPETMAWVETDLILPTGAISLAPLREELLLEISRGAARGVVDMTLPEGKTPSTPSVDEPLPWSQIRIGPPPETSVVSAADGKDGHSPLGATCIPDELVSVAGWGDGRRPLDLLTEARSGLYGEFDKLDPQETLRAIRLHIYLGFGAEAAQYTMLLPASTSDEEIAVLRSMALMVDGATDPNSPFADMLACDGTAALWAALSFDHYPPGAVFNSDAVARSFLALPPHLRAALGRTLADRLLRIGETEAARIVRDAVGRTPDVTAGLVDLLDAKAELQADAPEEALKHAAAAIAEDGSDVDTWVALVEAHFRSLEPMPPENADALRAFAGEVEGSEIEVEYFRALALAEILSGQTTAGFTIAEEWGVPQSDLWRATVSIAKNDAFIGHAVTLRPEPVALEIANAVAERLVSLGFPDAAVVWLTPTGPDDTPERRRIGAKAELARGDARRSLDLLVGLNAPEDEALRAEALVQLGRIAEARVAYEAGGQADAALRLAAWDGAWAALDAAEAPGWAQAVAELDTAPHDIVGPLARADAIIDASAASRASIDALLAEVALPGL